MKQQNSVSRRVRLVSAALISTGAISVALSSNIASAVPPTETPLEVTQTSSVSVLPTIDTNNPVTSSLNLDVANAESDLDITADVSISGTDPGALSLDQTGLTLDVTTETDTSIVFSGSSSDVVTALESKIEWEAPQSPGTVTLSVEITQDLPENAFFNSETGHIYLADPTGRNRSSAGTYASGLELWGTEGHLVSITTEAENDYLKDAIDGSDSYWIGAGDFHDEGEWEWKYGPGTPDFFFQDLIANRGAQGSFGSDFYWWGTGEPSNSFNCIGFTDDFIPVPDCRFEDDAVFNASSGEWFDQDERSSRGVIVEFTRDSTDDPSNDTLEVDLTVASRHAHLIDYADNDGTTAEYPTAPDATTWTDTGAEFPSAQPAALSAGVGATSLSDEEFATALNTFLALQGLSGTDVDTLDDVQEIIDAFQQLLDYIATGSDAYLPDAALYEILGFGTLNSSAVNALNRRILQAGPSAIGSANDLLVLVESVADIKLNKPRPRYFLPVVEPETTELPNTN